MKKIMMIMAAAVIAVAAQAEVKFAYEAGAEVVTAYLWRGQLNGGLSFQPDLEVGFDTENTGLRVGTWISIGASDWQFKTNAAEKENNTFFIPEVDLMANYSFYGATVGLTYYQLFNYNAYDKKYDPYYQLEVTAGYNFGDLLNFPLYINWNTMVAGDDDNVTVDVDPNTGEETESAKRAWSSYLEVGYDHSFPYDITLGGKVGMSPWKSGLYGNDRFAVVNVSVRLQKDWDLDVCQLSLFAEGAINPYGVRQDKNSVFINKAGMEKVYCQTMNGTIGLGVWF
ncbi:MAG: hypothetical protein IJP52_02045 [Paludibacteraceae bacterium]|nr:hypothetical protein [Paludibacteraceae bacterium]